MNQTISLIVGAFLIIGIGGLVFWQKQEAAEEQAALQAAQEAQQQMNGTSADSESINSNASGDADNDGDEIDDDGISPPPGTTSGSTGGTTSGTASYTSADVAKHNTRASCWSSINGGVYDLTSWIPKHPGGEQAILSICGIDGSAKFNGQHGGAALQARILAGFKIGVLK